MNRFEQKNRSLWQRLIYLLPILAFIVLFVLFLQGIGSVSESTLSKQQESLETALERSISQCYAVEGSYPPSLEYLKQHYGLLYDETNKDAWLSLGNSYRKSDDAQNAIATYDKIIELFRIRRRPEVPRDIVPSWQRIRHSREEQYTIRQ